MAALGSKIRRSLEKGIVEAREAAEKAADAALRTLAVDQSQAFATLTEEKRRLRNALRALARQFGGPQRNGLSVLLIEEVAYEQWHRMLFARFLAENRLLMHPSGTAVTIDDCAELAAGEREPDAWQLAARYASRMLPGIFRTDDPSVQVALAPEGRAALEAILDSLPSAIFTSDDGLGWVYQFWQAKRKKEVSGSGRKIEGLDLAAYSQLFTEDYMVRFLLENSLGAWWATHHPDSQLVKEFTYLRFQDDGTPAGGIFPGWPDRAAEVTVMDPCCGSGHFLVAALEMLRRMRMEEEGLSESGAADAVIRDNLFGLEIDPRCIQIAAFSLALAAWKAGGYRLIPIPNLACSGIAVSNQPDEWTKLAGTDVDLKHSIERLYYLFRNAADLGSLINPADVPIRDRMFAPDFGKVAPLLERALARERGDGDPTAAVFGEAARGVASAAVLLSRQYTVVATNVPYLALRKQGDVLKNFIERQHRSARGDLATAFVQRCRAFTAQGGAYAIVTPQNWLFLSTYTDLRRDLLKEQSWRFIARLGSKAFESFGGEVVKVVLAVLQNSHPSASDTFESIDASSPTVVSDKIRVLVCAAPRALSQVGQLENPDARISLEAHLGGGLLAKYADGLQGISTGDAARFFRKMWELPLPKWGWEFLQSTVKQTLPYGGRDSVVFWQGGTGELQRFARENRDRLHNAHLRGIQAWGKMGVAVSQMQSLPTTLYTGERFDANTAVVLPKSPDHLPVIWAFCSSPEFGLAVRRIDAAMKVTNATLVKVPFDLARWQKVSEESGPPPKPCSNDPTQWMFNGNPAESEEPLQVAVARLLGYNWPKQELDRLSAIADRDGVVPLVPVAGEEPAEERLRAMLASAYGERWSAAAQERLLQQVGFGGNGLDAWLRDGFFEQHCQIFHQRPFIWHVWDGRKDGFSALLNYHRLDAACLAKLIYTYLGEWIRTQRAAGDEPGAEARLVAALDLQKKLEAIRDGEPPYDIYARWKPLHQQPIGWNPDLNDGVRLNIRPFVATGMLRSRVNVKWGKDPGLNPDGSDRINDRHFPIAEKQAARRAAGP